MRAGEGYRHGVLAMWPTRVRSIPVHGRFDFSEPFAFSKAKHSMGSKLENTAAPACISANVSCLCLRGCRLPTQAAVMFGREKL